MDNNLKFLLSKPPASKISDGAYLVRFSLLDETPSFLANKIKVTSTHGENVTIYFGLAFNDEEIRKFSDLFSVSYIHLKSNAWTTVYHQKFFDFVLPNIVLEDVVCVLDLFVEEFHLFDSNKKCTTYSLYTTEFNAKCFYRTNSFEKFKLDLQLIKYHSNVAFSSSYVNPNWYTKNDFLYNLIKEKFGE